MNTVQYRECKLKIIQSCGTFNTCSPNSSENTGEGLTGKSYLLSPLWVTNAVRTLKLPCYTDLTQGVLEAGQFLMKTLLLGEQYVMRMWSGSTLVVHMHMCSSACVQLCRCSSICVQMCVCRSMCSVVYMFR